MNVTTRGVIAFSPVLIADMNGDGRPDIVFPWQAINGLCANFCIGTPPGVGVLLNTTQPPAPDFTVSAASGSATSKTISAGQTADFTLVVTPSGSFNGPVTLSCAITPAVMTAAPICSLSPSTVQISGGAPQPVTVTVKTSASVAAGVESTGGFPPPSMPVAWWLALFGIGCVLEWKRRRLAVVASLAVVFAFAFSVGCGGSSPNNVRQGSPGTPTGTYVATVTANSGTLSHSTSVQVVVQ